MVTFNNLVGIHQKQIAYNDCPLTKQEMLWDGVIYYHYKIYIIIPKFFVHQRKLYRRR